MLRFLSVQNLAVIQALEIEFEPGLTVLTGETGAGKSILVEAVGLLLGGRASPDLIRTGEEVATVQAIFDDGERELIVRREITAQGRSRAFADGSLTTASGLKELGSRLVDLHGQHEHQTLLDPDTHLDVLDAFAGLEGRRQTVAAAFERLRSLGDDLARVQMNERQKAERIDLVSFQLGEISRARPRAGEDEELQATRQLLASADRVQRLCTESYSLLYESDEAVLAGLGHVWKRVGELGALDPKFMPYLEARDAIKSQLEDLASFLRTYSDAIDASPARLQEIEDRLALVERLKRKYGPTLGEVIARQASLKRELDALEGAGERAAELEAELKQARAYFEREAGELGRERRAAAGNFARGLERELRDLAMDRTRFEVRFNAEPLGEAAWTARGMDDAQFFVSPNPGEDLRPLARIVSGGELSRIMLALKTLASTDVRGKTLIFDEVDAGIGGRVADAVGSKLQGLGRDFQVLCITHLPQIAAYAGTHLHISKSVRQNRTVTRVDGLEGETRVEELARMIGGAVVSDVTRRGAREMLAARRGESEENTKGEGERAKAKARRHQ